MKWVRIEKTAIPVDDGIRKIKVGGKRLCLIREQGRLYATAVRCPHAGADLSQGWCEEGRLICPYHRHAFDLKTGKGDPGQADYIPVFPLREESDGWYVGVKESWIKKIFGSS